MATFDSLASEVSKLLNDYNDCADTAYNFTRWSKSDLIHYAKDAIITLSLLNPSWFAELKTITLRPGRVQQVPVSCTTLVKVIGVSGSVDADSPIASTVNGRLGGIFPSGCAGSTTSKDYKLLDYTMEAKAKNIFYVNPPVPDDGGEVKLDVICSAAPDTDDKDYEVLPWMHNLVVEWMLYRAFISDEENAIAEGRASQHLQYFYTMINNIKAAEQSSAPIARRIGNEAV